MTLSLVPRSLHVIFECCVNLAIADPATGHIFVCNSCNKEKKIQQISSNLMILHFFVATLLHFGPFIEKLSFS